MKKILVAAGLVLLVGTCLFSCKKKEEAASYSYLSSVRTSMARQPVRFDMDAGTGGTFTAGRCIVTVPPNAFQLNGTIVSGNVTLQVRDILRKGEMVFSALPMSYDGRPLVSGGEVEVYAMQNNVYLNLQAGKSIEVKVPQFGNDATGMGVFMPQWTEDTTSNGVTLNTGNLAWRENKNGRVVVGSDTVSLFVDTLGWVNIDRYLNNPNYQSFTVTLTGVTLPTRESAFVGAVYDQYNGAWRLFGNGALYNTYQESHVPNIPVHFVGYAVIDGKFYGGITAATPVTGANYTLNLTETKPEDFKKLVEAL